MEAARLASLVAAVKTLRTSATIRLFIQYPIDETRHTTVRLRQKIPTPNSDSDYRVPITMQIEKF